MQQLLPPRRRPTAVAAVACLLVVAPVLAAAACGADERPPVRVVAPDGWHLAWHDEFEGESVDRAKWRVEDRSTFGDGNGELACLMDRPHNVGVDDGALALRAVAEDPPLRCGDSDERMPRGRQYSSAMLSTRGTADWVYGRFEARARLPTEPGASQGLWPAFWLRPTDGGVGELDVVEAVGTGPDASGTDEARSVHQTLWYDYSGAHPRETTTVVLPDVPSDGFHTYAVEWDPGAVRWYVDGRMTYSRDTATTPWLDEALARPFFLRVNLAVGGRWPGAPDGTTKLPATLAVDYVRVFQRDA